MAEENLKQRLAAILAADAAGYSRLMAADERATIIALDTARGVFRSCIARHGGRVIDMAGDSVLALFESAAGAVNAALAIQPVLETNSQSELEDRRMRFRIGLHLGDVTEKADGTIYGDGVNIAARLQALAQPGGIWVSDAVRGAVKSRLSASFEDQGEHQMKNIAEPMRTFALRAAGDDTARAPAGSSGIQLSLPDKPSIAVLPFTNMSGDPEQEYFADGIVEDIITELSRFQRLFVIARNTSFTYKGRSIDVKKVARELGVHFVLEGSVRKAGNQVRITAQLVEGDMGRHVWAERYDEVLSDVFELQERITRQVVSRLVPEIDAEEMRLVERGRTRFTEAHDIAWRALKAWTDGLSAGQPELVVDAARLAEIAIEKDTTCGVAWQVLGLSHVFQVFYSWTKHREESLAAARRAADTVMTLAPTDNRSYFLRGWVQILSGNFASGIADQRRAHELNPSDTSVLFVLAWTEAAAGNVGRAKELAAQAIRMSPKDRWLGTAHLAFAMCALVEQDWQQLHDWSVLAIQSLPTAPIRRVLIIAYAAETGDGALLRTHLDKLTSVAPDFIPSLFRGNYRPFHDPAHMKVLLDSLRKAGLGN